MWLAIILKTVGVGNTGHLVTRLYCKVCGESLRGALGYCSNGCCNQCHAIYCKMPKHTIDVEDARARHGDLLMRSLNVYQCPTG